MFYFYFYNTSLEFLYVHHFEKKPFILKIPCSISIKKKIVENLFENPVHFDEKIDDYYISNHRCNEHCSRAYKKYEEQ